MRTLPVGDRALLIEVMDSEEAGALHAELLQTPGGGGAARRGRDRARGPDRAARRSGRSRPMASRTCSSGRSRCSVRSQRRTRSRCPSATTAPIWPRSPARWKVAPHEVAAIHSAVEFRVAFCGFAPGFGYLTGLRELSVPRRATPRTSVPAGAVALPARTPVCTPARPRAAGS